MSTRRAIPWGLASLAILALMVVAIQGRTPRIAPLPILLEQTSETWPPSEPNPGKAAVVSMGPAAVPTLLQVLQSSQWYESQVLQSLRQRFPRVLGEWVRDATKADHCRRIAAWLLGELGPDAAAAVPVLRRVAASPGPDDLHALVVLALARIEPHNPTAFSNAAALLASSSEFHRYYASPHLGAFTNHPNMDPLILLPALSDTNGWIRANAAFSLAGYGARARQAAPRLRELLSDPHPDVGMYAAYALASISPTDQPLAAAAFERWDQKGEGAQETVYRFFKAGSIGAGLAPAPGTAAAKR